MASKAVNHALLKELHRADQEVAKRFPSFDPGLGAIGLILDSRFAQPYDWCTPLNCRTFAGTGGDGAHFSLVELSGEVREDSPVIVTVPLAGGLNFVVGENLFDFLCFGSRRGFFAIEQLAYELDITLRAYTDLEWKPHEKWHYSVGYDVSESKRVVLDFITDRFGLRPWPDAARFAELQQRFVGELVTPNESAQ